MEIVNTKIFGEFTEPETSNVEGALSFSFKAGYLEKGKLWKSKDISAEFIGDFWKNILDIDDIKPTLHFICAELLENAVYHSVSSNYLVRIGLFFKTEELLIYVTNSLETEKIPEFSEFINTMLTSDNLQKMFIQRMKAAKKSGTKKSQVGLITIMKDRGATLSWKIQEGVQSSVVTTLAKIKVQRKEEE